MGAVLWDQKAWSQFVDEAGLAGIAGQALDVEVTPDDGLEHDAEVVVRVSVAERAIVPEPTP